MSTLIKKIRKEIGWSQKRLGEYLDLTQSEVSHLECGRRNLTFHNGSKLIQLASEKGRNISLDNFCTLEKKDGRAHQTSRH